jgi:hypothetical protein
VRAALFRSQSRYFAILLLTALALLSATAAHAGFYIDDFEVDDVAVGACAVESWMSFASNKDFMAATSPSCVVQLGAPVEIGAEFQRSRENGEWKTTGGLSGKVTLVRMTKGIGIGLSGEANWNLVTGASTGGNINIPVSFDIGKNVRLNVNGGYLYDAPTQAHFGTWGLGAEWAINPKVALIGEVFGQLGAHAETTTTQQPRFQTGVRYSPRDNLDLTLIYGRNLNGENANWVTLGTTFSFQAN